MNVRWFFSKTTTRISTQSIYSCHFYSSASESSVRSSTAISFDRFKLGAELYALLRVWLLPLLPAAPLRPDCAKARRAPPPLSGGSGPPRRLLTLSFDRERFDKSWAELVWYRDRPGVLGADPPTLLPCPPPPNMFSYEFLPDVPPEFMLLLEPPYDWAFDCVNVLRNSF